MLNTNINNNLNILLIIPARGGSKAIPRKNIRSLKGEPLIAYVIKTAKKSFFKPDIYVSSDDDEILNIAEKYGIKTHKRDPEKARDDTTLDPVVYDVYQYATMQENKIYNIIITLQPTSPLLSVESLDKAIYMMIKNPAIDTIISAKESTHLSWRRENDRYFPNFTKRVNRQYLTPTFIETGAFLITRARFITEQSRIGSNVELYLLNGKESIDINTFDDWNLCEYHLRRKKILFVTTGNKEVGLGHVYNTLLIANDITNHEIIFLVDAQSQPAYNKIAEQGYQVYIQRNNNIIEDIKYFSPDIVINDRLDTTKAYMQSLKDIGVKVVNFEDLGEGAVFADIVINAIYPEREILPNHYFGSKYFLLRDEFILSPKKDISETVSNVLIAFGGVDPNNYTEKVLKSVYDYCIENNIKINVIAGLGYDFYETIKPFKRIEVFKNTKKMSEHMLKADILFTSAGRTIFEAASIGIPTIVLAQNSRELSHFFASAENGFLNLGLGTLITPNDILYNFRNIVESFEIRRHMNTLMKQTDLTKGRTNVIKLISKLLEEI